MSIFFLRVREFFDFHRMVGRTPRGLLTPGYFEPCNFPSRILEWVAISFSRVSSWPMGWTQGSCVAGGGFTSSHLGSPSHRAWGLTGVNWGKPRKTGWLGFFLVSLCLQRQKCSFPRYREGTSHLRVLWPISGNEGGGGEEKVPAISLLLLFTQTLSA